MGPTAAAGFLGCVESANCTLTHLDVSDNPIGYSVFSGGDAVAMAVQMRAALSKANTLMRLNCDRFVSE